MLKAIAALITVLQVASFAQATEITNLPAGVVIQDIAGEYVSAKGDVVKVEVTEDKTAPQPDLFTKTYLVDVVVQFANLNNEIEVRASDIDFKADGSFRIYSDLECEDPGCEEYELDLAFAKNAKAYSLEASLEYSRLVDDEGPAESQEQANEMCSYLVGQQNVIEALINDDGSVYCNFSEDRTALSKK